MKDSPPAYDFWRVPTCLLWVVFFLIGLAPERVFLLMREWGHVKSQSALVNSHYLITLGLSGFLAYFTYCRCMEAEMDELTARGKGLQTGIFGLVAFLPVPWALLANFEQIPKLELRLVVLFACGAKSMAWVYLLSVLLRYYLWSGERVYKNMLTFLPSLHQPGDGVLLPDLAPQPDQDRAPESRCVENGLTPDEDVSSSERRRL